MPRNSSGTYSLPVAAYVAGSTIKSADMNSNLSDIASALSTSIASTGVTTITAPIKFADGSSGAPSLTTASESDTGWYRSAAGSWTFVSSGTGVATISSTGLAITGILSVSSNVTITGTLTVTGAITAPLVASSATTPLTVKNTTNNASENTLVTFQQGDGTGDNASIRALGTGSNDITQVRVYVSATEVIRLFTSQFSPKKDISLDAGIIVLATAGYIDLLEISVTTSASVTPSANAARIYVKDTGAYPEAFYTDDSGREHPISPVGCVIGRGYGEYTVATSVTANINGDDSIPQVGEGTEIISFAYTVKYATSRIRVKFQGMFAAGATGGGIHQIITAALFADGAADAIQASGTQWADANTSEDARAITFEGEYIPGATGAITYSVRVGANSGTAYTNSGRVGGAGSRLYGGVAKTTLVVEEILQ